MSHDFTGQDRLSGLAFQASRVLSINGEACFDAIEGQGTNGCP